MRDFSIWRLLERLPTTECVFVELHVDALAAELYAFHGEAEALLGCGFTAEFDFASSPDDALPGEALHWSVTEQAGDGSVVERITGGSGDLAVGGDFAFGHGADYSTEGVVSLLVFAETFFEDAALQVLWDGSGAHGF
jgi:hypothetical protein